MIKKRIFISILFLFCLKVCYGQDSATVNLINRCLIFSESKGDPLLGLEINYRDKNVKIELETDKVKLKNIIGFNESSQIDYVRTSEEESFISYTKNSIKKKIFTVLPIGLQDCFRDTILYKYLLDDDGKIIKAEVNCLSSSSETKLNFKYTSFPGGLVVEEFDKNTLVVSNIFTFGKNGEFFQWEIKGSSDIYLKFKRNQYRTTLGSSNFNMKETYFMLEKESINEKSKKRDPTHWEDELILYSGNWQQIGIVKVMSLEK